MLVGYIACRCAMYLMRLKSDDYTCRTVRKWLVDAGSIPASSTTHGGQIFSVPLFLSRKALYLRACALFLVDAVGQISLVLVLRTSISLFFLSWLVDVSMRRVQYSCRFQGLGWTLSLHQQRG